MKKIILPLCIGICVLTSIFACGRKDKIVTNTITNLDTLTQIDTLKFVDTTVVFDTLYLPVWDTLRIPIFDTTFIHDTTTIFDTTFVPNYDTFYFPIYLWDTLYVQVHDTTIVHDTLFIALPPDTMVVHDTIFIHDGGIPAPDTLIGTFLYSSNCAYYVETSNGNYEVICWDGAPNDVDRFLGHQVRILGGINGNVIRCYPCFYYILANIQMDE